MKLTARSLGGEGLPPLVVLHGLLGSSRNWVGTGKRLAEHFDVTALDLRGHGESPHAPEIDYSVMAEDVLEWLDGNALAQVDLMGHSLGGKVAMRLACRWPARVRNLFILDIAPRAYAPNTELVDAMLAVDLSAIHRRSEVDEQLRGTVAGDATRAFLLTNLARGEDGTFGWRADVEVLRDRIDDLSESPLDQSDRFDGPTLFVLGGRSGYVTMADHQLISRHFPNATIEVIEDSGHNVHFDRPEEFVRTVVGFAGDWGLY